MSRILAAVLAGAAIAIPVRADPPKDGRAVMEEVDKRRKTASEFSEGAVTVEEKGKSRTKAWRSWRIGWGADVKSLLQFLEPPEVKGVSLLTLSRPGAVDEQWFYVPSIDRERRIAEQEKSTRFLGTHYTYEDMEERSLDDHTYRLLGEEARDGIPCYKVESVPIPGKKSQYEKSVVWVDAARFVVIRSEGWADGAVLRTFVASDFREVDGVLSAHRFEVRDAKRPGRTTLEVRGLQYRLPIDPAWFAVKGMSLLHPAPERKDR